MVTIERMEQKPLEDMLDIGSDVEPWVIDLRAQLVDAGYECGRVEELITSNRARFRLSKHGEFVPLLVERSVQRALRGD